MPDVLPTSQSIPYLPRSRPYHLCHCMYLIVTHPISNSRPGVAEISRAMLSHRRHAASRPRSLGQRTQRSALAHLRRDTSHRRTPSQPAYQGSSFLRPKQKKPHPTRQDPTIAQSARRKPAEPAHRTSKTRAALGYPGIACRILPLEGAALTDESELGCQRGLNLPLVL
jgi:hypothetical protein